MRAQWIKLLFLAAGLYDLTLGLVFCFAFKPIYGFYNATLPNHDGYIQLPALLIAVFGAGFLCVARDPVRNRAIILLGIMMKAVFSGVVFTHWALGTMPGPYLPFAWLDACFAALFVLAYRATGSLQAIGQGNPPSNGE